MVKPTIKIRIGRDPRCDIALNHPTVSAQHAELSLIGEGKWLLTDCHSRNGTFQNLMHLLLFAGFGELVVRWQVTRHEAALVAAHLLPEDARVVLQSQDLPAIRAQVVGRYDSELGILPGLIDLCILQFQSSRSVDQVVSVLNSSLELIAHRLDLRYALLRYLVWVIPTIGFIGTVIGIALALNLIDPSAGSQPLGEIAQALGIAFYTTLVALVESALLVLLLNLVQTREERVLNQAGHYTLVNLVNRLYAGRTH